MKDVLGKLTALFFPRRCYICDRVLPYPETVCEKCVKLPLHYGNEGHAVCEVCGLAYKQCICGPARFYAKAVFPLYYEGDVRRSLHKLKFRGRTDKAECFSLAMLTALNERDVISQTDILTYIPMSEARQKQRGYNQAEVLCKTIAEKTGLPMLPLLNKYLDGSTQHELRSSVRRRGNSLGAYEPNKALLDEIANKRILVIDDILTSGATLNEAAKTLLIFGADRVFVCAAAATPKRTKNKEQKTKHQA